MLSKAQYTDQDINENPLTEAYKTSLIAAMSGGWKFTAHMENTSKELSHC